MSIGSKRTALRFGDGDADLTRGLAPDFAPAFARDLVRLGGGIWSTVVAVMSANLLALFLGAACAMAQENACAAQDPRQACSYQCCGRRSCPPSCEVDCVKLCVDACGSQTRSLAYDNRKRDLQLRCGNKGAR